MSPAKKAATLSAIFDGIIADQGVSMAAAWKAVVDSDQESAPQVLCVNCLEDYLNCTCVSCMCENCETGSCSCHSPEDAIDRLIAEVSGFTLADLFRAGKATGLISPIVYYHHAN